jgi:hypothetical protein
VQEGPGERGKTFCGNAAAVSDGVDALEVHRVEHVLRQIQLRARERAVRAREYFAVLGSGVLAGPAVLYMREKVSDACAGDA